MVADAGQRLRCLTCSPSRRDLPWSQALVSVSSASRDGYLGVNPFAMVARYPSCDMTATSPSLATPLPHAHRLLRSHLRSLHSFPHSFINSSQHRSRTLLHYFTQLQYPSSISTVANGSSVISNNNKNSYFLFRRSCSISCKGEGVAWSSRLYDDQCHNSAISIHIWLQNL